ncbi:MULTISPECIES: recombinase family protein [unclassified Streptomyces]|uniref:Recombinase family protein n=1 Tax=Streptomyces sp. NBC_00060 TaxID=2975636 RepID=A0AAU2GWE3_9ACTN
MLTADTAWAVKVKEFPDGRGGYARVSMNRNGQSVSVVNQFGDVRLTFDDQGWPVSEGLLFSDDDISASEFSTKERPGFILLREAIRQRRLWLIVVTEVARITRNMEVAIDFVKLQKAAGGVVVMTTDGRTFDLKTQTGIHDFYAAVVEASRESGVKSDRMKRNKRNVSASGRYHGGRPRYGRVRAVKDEFGRVVNTGKVGHDIVEEEAEILRETIDRICEGWPLASIVRDLKERGIVGVNGEPFQRTVLRKAISSKHLIGVQESKGREYPGAFPPIITDRAKWEKAMAILRARGRTNSEARSYLTKARCGKCEGEMTGHYRDNRRTYQCRAYNDHGQKIGCGMQRIADPVELLILDAVQYRYNTPGFIEALRRAYQESSEHDELGKLIDQVRQIQGRLDELEDAWTKGTEGLDLTSMLRMKATMQSELKMVNARMERSAAGQMVAAITTGGIKAAFDKADMAQLRVYVDLIVEEVRIEPIADTSTRPRWKHEATGRSWLFDYRLVKIKFKY